MAFKEYLEESLKKKPRELKTIKGATPEIKKIINEANAIVSKAEDKLNKVYDKYNALRNIAIVFETKGDMDADTLSVFLDSLKEVAK
jgi:SMC interacting uncharacterized protein involved in chromosome segregation